MTGTLTAQDRFCGHFTPKQVKTTTFKLNSLPDTLVVPVVFHVLYNSSTTNISDAQIYSQINVLNQDYLKQNADTVLIPSIFKSYAKSMNIKFEIANTDPSGKSTNGILRKSVTKSTYLYSTDEAKFDSLGGDNAWDVQSYLNVWIVPKIKFGSSNVIAYSSDPSNLTDKRTDGVVVQYNCVGSVGTLASNFNKGRTLTHEIGHWLGLYHPFEGGCSGLNTSTCASEGDLICDTPPSTYSSVSCAPTVNTCSETNDTQDMTSNFMGYSVDTCMNFFTNGQYERMRQIVALYRSSITSSNGLMLSIHDKNLEDNISIYSSNEVLNILNLRENVNYSLFNSQGVELANGIVRTEYPQIPLGNIKQELIIVKLYNKHFLNTYKIINLK